MSDWMQQGVDAVNAADDAKQLRKRLGLPKGAGDDYEMQRVAAELHHAKALAEALRTLTCQDDGTFNALRDDFPDGGDIVLRWDGNRRDWEAAAAALAAYDKDHER